MTDNLPAEYIQRGWNSEVQRRRRNLDRTLDAVARNLDKIRADPTALQAAAARQLAHDAVEVAQLVAALEAIDQVRFALPDQDS